MSERPSKESEQQLYAAFIGQVELRSIWLRAAKVDNQFGYDPPASLKVSIDGRTEWEPLPDGFLASHTYRLRIGTAADDRAVELEVTFGVDFASRQQMNDEFFAVFSEVNLPVNTWPFLREYASTTLGRMGWTPITLPAFKVGTGGNAAEQPEEPPKRKRRRKPVEAVTESG